MRNFFKDLELRRREGSSSEAKIALVVCCCFVLLFLSSEEKGNKFIAKGKELGIILLSFIVIVICVLTFSVRRYKHLESETDSHSAS